MSCRIGYWFKMVCHQYPKVITDINRHQHPSPPFMSPSILRRSITVNFHNCWNVNGRILTQLMIFWWILTRNWPHDKFLENDFFHFWNVIRAATISYLAFVLEMHSKRNPIHPSRSKQFNFRLYTPNTCSHLRYFLAQNVYSIDLSLAQVFDLIRPYLWLLLIDCLLRL